MTTRRRDAAGDHHPATVSLSLLDGTVESLPTPSTSRSSAAYGNTNSHLLASDDNDEEEDLVDVPLVEAGALDNHRPNATPYPRQQQQPPQERPWSYETLTELRNAAAQFHLRGLHPSEGDGEEEMVAMTLLDTSLLSLTTPEKQASAAAAVAVGVTTTATSEALHVLDGWSLASQPARVSGFSEPMRPEQLWLGDDRNYSANQFHVQPPRPKSDPDASFRVPSTPAPGSEPSSRNENVRHALCQHDAKVEPVPTRRADNASSPIDNVPPPETLWERNKTLVKEVRFADQTCVELSAKNVALEQQVQFQQHQIEQYLRLLTDQLQQRQHRNDANDEEAATALSCGDRAEPSSSVVHTPVAPKSSSLSVARQPVHDAADVFGDSLSPQNGQIVDPILNEQVTRLQAECASLRVQMEALGTENSELQAQLKETQASRDMEVDVWKKRVEEMDADAVRRRESFDHQERELQQLSASEHALLTQQIQGLERQVESLRFWKDRVSEVEALNVELTESVASLEQLLAGTNQELDASRVAIEKASEQCATYKERVGELESLSRDQSFSASARKQQLDDVMAEKMCLLDEKAALESTVSSLIKKVSDLECICSEKSEVLDSQQHKLDDSISARNRLDNRLQQSNDSIQRLEKELKDLRQSHEGASSRCSGLQDEIEKLMEQERRAKEENLTLLSQVHSLQQDQEATRSQLAEESAAKEAACAENLVLISRVDSLQQDLDAARSLLAVESAAKETISAENLILLSRADSLQQDLETARSQLTEESAAKEATGAENLVLISRVDSLQQDLDAARSQLAEESAAKEATSAENLVLISRVDSLQQDLDAARSQLAEESAAKEATGAENLVLISRVDSLQQDLDAARSQLAEALATKDDKCAELTARLAATQSSLLSLETECRETFPRVAATVRSTILQVDRDASELDRRVSQSLFELIYRVSDIEKDVNFIKESTDFQVESQKAEEVSLDREVSTLTGNSVPSRERGDSLVALPLVAVDELMNATFDTLTEKDNDLELMEEARVALARATPASVRSDSNAVSDVTDDQDSFSSIEGLSHLFAPNNGNDLSLSISRSAEQADHDEQHETSLTSPDSRQVSDVRHCGDSISTALTAIQRQLLDVTNERDGLRKLVNTIELENAELKQNLKAKEREEIHQMNQLDVSTSRLALVREERDALQFKVNQMSWSPQKSVGSTLLADSHSETGSERCDRCHLLRERFDSLVQVQDAVVLERDALRLQVDRLRNEKEEVLKDLRDTTSLLTKQSEDYATEIKRHRDENDSIVREGEVARQATESGQAALKTLTRERDQLLLELETAQRRCSDSLANESAQRLEMANMRDGIEALGKMRDSLEERVQVEVRQRQQLCEEHERWRSELTSLNTKYIEASKKVEDLEQVIDVLTREKEDIASELGAMMARDDDIERQCIRLKDDLAFAEQQRDALRTENASIQQQVTSMSIELAEALSNLENSKSSNSTKDESLEVVSKEKAALQATCEELKSEVLSMGALLQAKEQQCELLDEERVRSIATLSNLQRDVENLENSKRLLEQDLEARELELDEAREQCGRLRAASEQASADLQQLTQALAQSDESRHALERSLLECEERNAALEEAKSEMEAELNHYVERLKDAENCVSHTEELASHAETRWIELQNELSVALIDRDELMAKYMTLEQRNNDMHKELLQLSSSFKEKEAELDAATNAKFLIERDLQRLRDSFDESQLSLRQEMEARNNLSRQVSTRDKELEDIRRQLDDLVETLDDSDRRLAGFELSLQEKNEELSSLRSSNDKLDSKCNALRQYSQKLMHKCEEWETHCASQAQAFLKLKAAYDQIQRMLLERDQVSCWDGRLWHPPHPLACNSHSCALHLLPSRQFYSTERVIWTAERSTLAARHHTLEEEFDELARELLNCSKPL